jgi:type II secretory pathway pseudopilin PulG
MKNRQVHLFVSLKLHRSGPKKGYTLIEVMMIIAMVGIMTVATMSYLTGTKNDKAVETAAREVASAVREAQNYALTGKNASSPKCTTYEFKWNINSDAYLIEFANVLCGVPHIAYTLKNGVTFGNSGTVNFSIPNATIDNKKTIQLTKGSINYFVCVCQSGRITESATVCPATC